MLPPVTKTSVVSFDVQLNDETARVDVKLVDAFFGADGRGYGDSKQQDDEIIWHCGRPQLTCGNRTTCLISLSMLLGNVPLVVNL